MHIKELQVLAHQASRSKGFWDDHDANKHIPAVHEAFVAQKLALIMSEAAEAIEARRRYSESDEKSDYEVYKNAARNCPEQFDKDGFETLVKNSFGDELADIQIRLAELAEGLGYDLDWNVSQKLKYNATRPAKHGKAY